MSASVQEFECFNFASANQALGQRDILDVAFGEILDLHHPT